MALAPVAFIPPGCSAQCARSVQARANSFAYASVQSIYLYKITVKAVHVLGAPPPEGSTVLPQVGVPSFPLQAMYGYGVDAPITAFDYNDDMMACLCATKKQVHLWKVADAEPLTASKIPASLATMFQKEGSPSTMCIVGKYHILFGTAAGGVISLNTSLDNPQPRHVAIPAPAVAHQASSRTPTSPSNSSGFVQTSNLESTAPTVEGVTCLAVSPVRADIVAAGTSDGVVTFFTLNASTGLCPGTSLYPFPPPAKEKERLFTPAPLPVTTMAFDPSNQSQLLVASTDGGLALCDANNSSAPTVVFEWKEKVSGVAWIPGEAGAFYTVNSNSNCVQRWSTSSRTPMESFAPVETSVGILSVGCIDKDRVALTLTNGMVKVYHMASRETQYSTEPGHTDALLTARVARHDRDLVASAGVDGTIRLWNTRTMRLKCRIDVGVVMVRSIDWSSNGKYLVAALSSGEVVQYLCSTRREVWRSSVFPDMIHGIVWSPADSNVIVACSRKGVAVLSKDGQVCQRITTPSAAHSVDVDPSKGKSVAVGCSDHKIYIYSLTGSSEKPILTLSGHSDVVSCVSYNPAAPQYLLSGSYDGTVRLWDASVGDSHTASVNARHLTGHTDRVHAVAWCSVAPYLALSGSRDNTVRLWDVRNGTAVTSVRGHVAAVCSVASNADCPLVFWSAGMDGGMVAWSLIFLRHVYLRASLGTLERSIVADAASLMAVATGNVSANVVGGPAVNKLNRELKESAKPQDRMGKVLAFFDVAYGTDDLAQVASYGIAPNEYSADGKSMVTPNAKLNDAWRARARHMMDKARGRTVAAAGPAYRKDRLIEAAAEMLMVGNMEDYCSLLMEAGEWDRAIAVAPAISRDHWRGVCLRAGEAMEREGDVTRAVTYYIASGECVRAARLLASTSKTTESTDLATVIMQTCPQRHADATATMEPPHQTTVDTNGVSADAKVFQQSRWNTLAQCGNPRLTAAAYIASGNNDEALRVLAYAGEVVPAHLLVHTVPLREQRSIDTAFFLSMMQCARLHQWEEAVLCASRQSNGYHGLATLLALFQSSLGKPLGPAPSESLTSHSGATFQSVIDKLKGFSDQVRAECQRLQLPMDAAAIQQRHAADGLASQNQVAAMVISVDSSLGPVTSSPILQNICGFVESLLNVVLQDADGTNAQFYLQQAYNVLGYVALSTTNALSAEHRKVLSVSFLVGALMCVKVYRFPTLLNAAFTKAREFSSGDATLDGLAGKVQGTLGTYSPHSIPVDCSSMGSVLPVLGTDGRVMMSSLTGQPMSGPIHTLEDGASTISKEEALSWGMCCHFSPLGTGARMLVL